MLNLKIMIILSPKLKFIAEAFADLRSAFNSSPPVDIESKSR
jgi:hypothetical protein